MRWGISRGGPEPNDERDIIKYCWLPTWTGKQFVWLETVQLRQVYHPPERGASGGWTTKHEVTLAQKPEVGAKRVISRYCWWPTKTETGYVWFTWAKFHERYCMAEHLLGDRYWCVDKIV